MKISILCDKRQLFESFNSIWLSACMWKFEFEPRLFKITVLLISPIVYLFLMCSNQHLSKCFRENVRNGIFVNLVGKFFKDCFTTQILMTWVERILRKGIIFRKRHVNYLQFCNDVSVWPVFILCLFKWYYWLVYQIRSEKS